MLFAKPRLSLLALSLLVSTAIQAQDLPAPMIEAARKAVASNPEVQARWNGFKAAGNERDVARGGYLPQVDLTASIGKENRTNFGSYNFNGQQLTLNQMLFDGLLTPREVRRLGYASLTRFYELVEASETAALEAVRAYLDVVRYRELVEVATENYLEHKQSAGQVDERAKAGVGRGADVEQANGRLALAESNLLTELTNLHDVSARYLRIIGEVPPASLPGLPDPFKLGTLPDSVDVLMRDGLQGSPVLNAAVENVRAHQTAIQSRQSAYLPRVDVRAYQSRDHNSTGIAGDTDLRGAQAVLNYNLYRGGADRARVRQAVDLKEQSRDLQEKACRDVRQTLSIAYSDVRALNEQLRYRDQHRLSTEKSREAYRQQFNIGQRTLLDLLDSQNEYFEATRSYINARYNQITAQARTLAGMGRLVAALGVNRSDVPSARDAGQDRDGIDPAELCLLEESTMETLEKIKARAAIPSRARSAVAPATAFAPVTAPVSASALAPLTASATVPASASASASASALVSAKVSLSASALFDFDQSVIKADGLSQLDKLLDQMKGFQLDVVIAIGHTDSVGSEEYNNRLSLARAEAVKAYLISKGVEVKRVRAVGRGEGQPIADNSTKEGRAKNRRVDVEVMHQQTADKE
ncbi:MAG: TolC family outer membrane protein [Thiobacillus sp.]